MGMGDTRSCEQCGTVFVPRREHARFCCLPCRVAWDREHMGDSAAGASALQWSVTAMTEATQRLTMAGAWDPPRAFGVIGDAVWWVTIVDATLVRHHPAAYDHVLAARTPAGRRLIEGTLTGLRFVRNRIGRGADLAEFVERGAPGPGAGRGLITSWRFGPAPQPQFASLPPRGRAWELTRHRAYQKRLAGETVGDIFGRASAFLELAAANTSAIGEIGIHAAALDAPLLLSPAARAKSSAH